MRRALRERGGQQALRLVLLRDGGERHGSSGSTAVQTSAAMSSTSRGGAVVVCGRDDLPAVAVRKLEIHLARRAAVPCVRFVDVGLERRVAACGLAPDELARERDGRIEQDHELRPRQRELAVLDLLEPVEEPAARVARRASRPGALRSSAT